MYRYSFYLLAFFPQYFTVNGKTYFDGHTSDSVRHGWFDLSGCIGGIGIGIKCSKGIEVSSVF